MIMSDSSKNLALQVLFEKLRVLISGKCSFVSSTERPVKRLRTSTREWINTGYNKMIAKVAQQNKTIRATVLFRNRIDVMGKLTAMKRSQPKMNFCK